MLRYEDFIREKARAKREILGSTFFPRKPVVLISFESEKMFTQYKDILSGLESVGVTTFCVLPPKVKVLNKPLIKIIDEESAKKVIRAVDISIILNGSPNEAWHTHCIPVAPLETEKTVPYDPLKEKGNGFYFKKNDVWNIFAEVIRALETYKFPYDWENLVKEVVELSQ